jgi:ferric-dicitrate binding protein FerR (iron transport regulator)
MNDEELENLLKAAKGPAPRPEIRARVLSRIQKHSSVEPRAEVQPEKAPLAPQQRPVFVVRNESRRSRLWIAVATAAMLAVIAGAYVFFQTKEVPMGVVQSEGLRVERAGSERALAVGETLFSADSLSAQQRAGSRLAILRSSEGERVRLQLDAGRVFLRVSKAEGRFSVRSGTSSVEVLGTVFGVSANGEVTTANVYEGRVRLSATNGSLELTRGESGAATKGGAAERTQEDPALALAWARDWIRFQERPLGEVLDWIAANSAYQFRAPEAIRRQNVSVAIERESMSNIIETLMLSSNLQYSIQGNDVTIKGEN